MDWSSVFGPLEEQYGLPSGYLYRTAQLESSLNPSAKNPNSSAGGLFQFIDSTARQYGLTDRYDPLAASEAAARLARDNASYLRRELGREPTAAELYLAHQQGAGGAANMLTNRDATVGGDAITLNAGRSGQTAGSFADQWINKFNGGGMTLGNNAMARTGNSQSQSRPAAANNNARTRRNTSAAEEMFSISDTPIGRMLGIKANPSNISKAGMGDALSLIAGAMSGNESAPPAMAPPPSAHIPQVDPTMLARIAMGR